MNTLLMDLYSAPYALETVWVSGVSGLGIEPGLLPPGEHDVVLSIRDVPTRTLISGSIEVRSAAFARTVAITGGTVGAEGIRPVSDLRLWG